MEDSPFDGGAGIHGAGAGNPQGEQGFPSLPFPSLVLDGLENAVGRDSREIRTEAGGWWGYMGIAWGNLESDSDSDERRRFRDSAESPSEKEGRTFSSV